MTRENNQLDEYGKRVLKPLRQVPPMDDQAAVRAKNRFITQAEELKKSMPAVFVNNGKLADAPKPGLKWKLQHRPLMKTLAAIILALVVILAGSSLTVYAAQSSLPGDPLYAVKSWSEDVRLSMATSTDARLQLTLDFNNRRMSEISSLAAKGQTVDSQVVYRYQNQLDSSLQLAANLNDTEMHTALGQIKKQAESQGMTVDELITTLPPQADPALVRLQERLQEQVQLSSFGEADPQEFRMQIRERVQIQHGPQASHTPKVTEEIGSEPPASTPMPPEEGNGHQNNQPTDKPGNGNHGQNPTHQP